MKIIKLENKTLLVPTRIETEGVIGDKMLEITPEHIDYEKYFKEYERDQLLENDSDENQEGLLRVR